MSDQTITTAEQLLHLDEPGVRFELVRGELQRMTPAGYWHGGVTALVGSHLTAFIRSRRLGMAVGAETGFLIERAPDTVLAPDFAFIAAARIPADLQQGYFPGAPDLAVEVVSPSDRFTAVEEKAAAWLAAGTKIVWVLNPQRRSLLQYRPNNETRAFTATDSIDGGDVLPGFSLPVAELFPPTS